MSKEFEDLSQNFNFFIPMYFMIEIAKMYKYDEVGTPSFGSAHKVNASVNRFQ